MPITKQIGIVGGMGSYAGLDLLRKIYDLSGAKSDEEHLSVTLISDPQITGDRTEFLSGKSSDNPSGGIIQIIERLASQQANLIGIPCNTAHADPILNEVLNNLPKGVTLVHLIDSVRDYVLDAFPGVKKVGILATTGTIESNIYRDAFSQRQIEVLYPDKKEQQNYLMSAIYDHEYGIKSVSGPVTSRARIEILHCADNLIDNGAEVLILGCSEIPLAITEDNYRNCPLIDATSVLAKKLIKLAAS